jgi:hypothetical protein
LEPTSNVPQLPTQERVSVREHDDRELSVLSEIWIELKKTESINRLARFLEQVRGTTLEVVVRERIAQLERAGTSAQTADWLREARPILEQVKTLYERMGWKQAGPAPDARKFEANLEFLIQSLPPVPQGSDVVHITNTLEEYINVTLHHGLPIPDDYTLASVFPLPGSKWGQALERVEACVRPGVRSNRYHREGYGDISAGLIIEPDVIFKKDC